jgi:cytochrome c oxidase cbb3-type subunit 3
MSSGWSWFVIIGTLGSLLAAAVFLFLNRKTSGEETTGHEWDGIEELDNPLPFWWVGLFVMSIVYAVGYLAWYPGLGNIQGAGGWTSKNQLQEDLAAHEARFAPLYARLASLTPDELAEDRLARQVGRRLFINHCSTCHGITAEGTVGFPNLKDDDWIWGEGFNNVKYAIKNGRSAIMPAWGPALGEQGVSDMVQYLLALSGRDHGATAASRGRDQFTTICASCHGRDGTGRSELGAPNLTDDIWLYGGRAKDLANTLNNGRTGQMPSFTGVLDDKRIHILAGYINGLSKEKILDNSPN